MLVRWLVFSVLLLGSGSWCVLLSRCRWVFSGFLCIMCVILLMKFFIVNVLVMLGMLCIGLCGVFDCSVY